jgi:hypothetical protein
VNAQVRIGGTDDPHKLSVLDLNTDDSNDDGDFGLYLPRVSLSDVHKLKGKTPLNGAVVWNTNDEFYLGKGVYVWGDTIWVPIQRTIYANRNVQPITSVPFVTIASNPALGLGVTFQVPSAYSDMGNTVRFLWDVKANGASGYNPEVLISGTRNEVAFVPYDETQRTYTAKAKAISNNGASDSDWSAEVTSQPGESLGWYILTGTT